MMLAGEPQYTTETIERVMSCPATKTKLSNLRVALEGNRISKVTFSCECNHIEISIRLDNGDHVNVFTEEFTLMMLLRDPDIALQEQELYYKNSVYRESRRRKRKGTKTDGQKE